LALLFASIVSGWSWLLLIINPAMTAEVSPIEFWLADAFNLLGVLYMPHFGAAVILQIVIVLTFDTWVREGGRVRFITLTLALAAVSIVQPYIILLFGPLLIILTAYHVFSARRLTWGRALWLLIPFGIHAGLTAYQYLALNADPIWAAFTAQNQTLSPLVTYYLLGYLPFIIPMALGLRAFMVSEADDRWWLPIIWTALVAMLLYAPFPTQRRYLLGVQTPLAVMAAFGWSRAGLPRFRASYRRLAATIYVVLAALALVSMVFVNLTALAAPATHQHLYDQPDELAGYAWLRREAKPNDLALTVFDGEKSFSGGRLAAAVGQRVFLGHWIETIDFQGKVSQARRFYDAATDDNWRQEFLKRIGAVYIWYDEDARQWGDWNPAQADYLEMVFQSGELMIWRVRN
jgi:hypothetical protein